MQKHILKYLMYCERKSCMNKNEKIGELYKELRLARGLKLKNIATKKLTVSQLSKFERGQSMLSADRFLLAISGLNMNFAEFAHAMDDYQPNRLTTFADKLFTIFISQDVEGFKKFLEEKDRDRTIYDFIERIIIKNNIKSIEKEYEISFSEIERLTQYFYSIENWTAYELYVFGATVSLYSTLDLVFLGKVCCERSKKFRQLDSYVKQYRSTLANLISVLISRNELVYINFFITELENDLRYSDLFEHATLNFFKLYLEYQESAVKDKKRIIQHLQAIRTLGCTELAASFEENFNQWIKKI